MQMRAAIVTGVSRGLGEALAVTVNAGMKLATSVRFERTVKA